jgi:ribosomal protein L29
VTGDQTAVDAERRARVEAELADLRRQLARLRAVWTPEADEVVDDAGAENADGTDVVGGSSPAVAVDGAGDVDWGAVAKSRALWSPGADDSSGAETSSSPALGADDSTDGKIVVGAAAMDEDTAARIAAELAALRSELAGVRASTAADHSSVPAGETDADAAGGETAGPGVGGSGPGSGSVDWAALAKSRAVWSPSDDDGDGTEVDVVGVASSDGSTALGSSAGAAVASEDAERSRLLEEDLMWRRRMGMRENAQDDQPLGH